MGGWYTAGIFVSLLLRLRNLVGLVWDNVPSPMSCDSRSAHYFSWTASLHGRCAQILTSENNGRQQVRRHG